MIEDRMTKEEIVASCIAAGQAIDIDWTGKVHTFGEKMPFGEHFGVSKVTPIRSKMGYHTE
jgi:hypothetical protein